MFLKQGQKRGPSLRAIRRVMNQIEGPVFSVTFSQNEQKKYARPEAVIVDSRDSRGAVDSRIRFTGSIHDKFLTEVDSRSIHFEIR